MQKILKITFILTIILSFSNIYSNAETTNLYNDVINEEATSNTTSTDSIEDEEDDDDLEPLESTTVEPSTYAPSSTYSSSINTMSSLSEANLGLNNVLCIILISLSVLIVLLAIAILIRLKN